MPLVKLFGHLRGQAGLRQKPGLAELLDFLATLAELLHHLP
jgi:hypothetical protein